MAGLLVLVGLAVYGWFFWFLCRQSSSWKARASAFAIALSIPLWEVPFGYWSFYRHCSSEGGNHVDAGFRKPDSILIGLGSAYRPQDLQQYGFKIVEIPEKDKIVRYSFQSGGFVKTMEPYPISQFKYEVSGPSIVPGNLSRVDRTIFDIRSGRAVARQSDFRWNGTWWEAATNIFFFPQPNCPNRATEPLFAAVRNH